MTASGYARWRGCRELFPHATDGQQRDDQRRGGSPSPASDQTHTYGFGSLGTTGFSITSGTLYGSDAISGVTLATNDATSTSGNYKATSSPATLTQRRGVQQRFRLQLLHHL